MGCADSLGLGSGRFLRYRLLVLILTFFTYTSFHLSRKAPSIVKGILHPHVESNNLEDEWNTVNNPGWSPFSDDLNPSIVGPKGYTVSGSHICEANGKYFCLGMKIDESYYNLSYCPDYRNTNGKFSLTIVSPADSSRVKRLCNGEGVTIHNNTGCWVLQADFKNLTTNERKSLCTAVAGDPSKHDCVLYVQPGGHLIPAPTDDKIGWVEHNIHTRSDLSVETNVENGKVLLGSCDTVYLAFYAFGLFVSGHIADNMSLKCFLAIGMIGSGFMVATIGFAKVLDEHNLWYFYICYAIQGLFQATGWPAVVAVMANWFGKDTRGLVMGIWNSHTSVGNILGSLISGAALSFGMNGNDWPAAFYLSGGLIAFMGIIILIFLPNHPHDVNLPSVEEEDLKGVEYLEQTDGLLTTEIQGELVGERVSYDETKPTSNNFVRALCIPGVMEFAFALFFAKFVAYMFIYWLPYYLGHLKFGSDESANLSTAFDIGGIVGGIVAGYVSDRIQRRSPVAFVYLVIAIPSLYFYRMFTSEIGDSSIGWNILLMLVCGAFVNGPYALITTAVSADLGAHPSLKGNLSLTATVTGIIDGTGSIGASIQGVLIGVVASKCNATGQSWDAVFYLLMICCALSAVMLARLVWKDSPVGAFARSIYRFIVVLIWIGLLVVSVYCIVLLSNACGSDNDQCKNYS